MKMCFNWKVIAALAVAGLGVVVFAPDVLGAALPLLLLVACPLSMVVMMRAMSGGNRCDDRSTGNGGETGTDAASSEATRLRAELDQLQAERDAAKERGPSHQEHVT